MTPFGGCFPLNSSHSPCFTEATNVAIWGVTMRTLLLTAATAALTFGAAQAAETLSVLNACEADDARLGRRVCSAEPRCVDAPSGHFINPRTARVEITDISSSLSPADSCALIYSEDVTVIEGLEMPTRVCLGADARGDTGVYAALVGSVSCQLTVDAIALP